MAMTAGEKLAYQRGYARGRHGGWPEHRPPKPPHKLTGELVAALISLADAVDGECAKFLPDDELVVKLMAKVDAAREVLRRLDWHCVTGD